jgi:hypothetical protein
MDVHKDPHQARDRKEIRRGKRGAEARKKGRSEEERPKRRRETEAKKRDSSEEERQKRRRNIQAEGLLQAGLKQQRGSGGRIRKTDKKEDRQNGKTDQDSYKQ